MPTDTLETFAAILARYKLLLPQQQQELESQLVPLYPQPRALAEELIRRQWLTAYQLKQLWEGRAADLVLGAYVLLDLIGEGGMGQVFKARHQKLGRIVALKVIRKERLASEEARKRFHREIRAAAQLNHPNIVLAFDANDVGGTHFFVMEYVEGVDLNTLVKKHGPLPAEKACDYIRQAALGLHHAHERGLIHRDIKPANLLVATKGQVVKILDMGLARISHDAGADTSLSGTLTKEGAVMGTPDFLAPEQSLDAHTVDSRADLYSLGCSLYFLMTGRVPFPGGSLAEKLMNHQLREPTPLEALRPETPPAVATIVRTLMAKRPADRYRSPGELTVVLDDILHGKIPANVSVTPALAAPAAATAVVNPFADLEAGNTDVTSATPSSIRRPAAPAPTANHSLIIGSVVGGVLLVLIVIAVVLALGGKSSPNATPPGLKKVTANDAYDVDERKRQVEIEERNRKQTERIAWQKKLDAEAVEAEKKRVAEADQALNPLTVKAADSRATFAGFAKQLYSFNVKYSGTPASAKAAELLMRFPSPLDGLDHSKLSEDTRDAWRLLGMLPPPELVGQLGEQRRRHWTGITCSCVSRDGAALACGDLGGLIYIQTAAPSRAPLVLAGHTSPVQSLAFSPDGRILISGGTDYTARLWDTSSGKQIGEFKGPSTHSYAVALSPDAKWLATARDVGGVVCFHLDGREKPPLFEGQPGAVSLATFAAGGRRIVSAASDGTVRLWDLTTGKELQRFKDTSVVVSPDTAKALSWQTDAPVLRCWETDSGRETPSLENAGAGIRCMAFSTDGKHAVAGCLDGAIYRWDLGARKRLDKIGGDMLVVSSLYFADEKTIVSGSSDKTVRVWNLTDGKELRRLKKMDQLDGFLSRNRLAYHIDGNVVRFWNVDTGNEEQPLTGPAENVQSVAFSADNRRVLAASSDNNARIRDAINGQELTKVPGTKVLPRANDRGFVTLAADGTMRSFDAVGKTTGDLGKVHCVALSLDGRRAVAANPAGTIGVWDLDGAKQLHEFPAPASGVVAVAFAPDGKKFAFIGGDRRLRLWHAETGKELQRFDASAQSPISALAFSPTGRHVVLAHTHLHAVVLWEIGENAAADFVPLEGSAGPTTHVAVSPGGNAVASAADNGQVVVWDVATRKRKAEWRFPGPVKCVCFAPDGRHLATANGNGTVDILRLSASPPPPLTALEATQLQADVARKLNLPVNITNSIGIKLNLIPSGSFVMGSREDETGRRSNEGPQHTVMLTRSFYMGAFEVTQGQHTKVMGANPSGWGAANGGTPEHPVENMTWDEAVAFCKKLSEDVNEKKAGRIYRLPTEAEWEYACRAGSRSAFPFGDDESSISEHAWVLQPTTKPVGKLSANAWGLYDMLGNVWEWCADYYSADYYSVSPVLDPLGPPPSAARVIRGGGTGWDAKQHRSANRFPDYAPGAKASNVGFRIVCEIRPPELTPEQAKKLQMDAAGNIGVPVEIANGIGMKLKLIPAGTFLMGSPPTEEGRRENEGPQHEVTIFRPFYMGIHEVTQEQYEMIMGVNPASTKGATNPVESMTWADTATFCHKLNAMESERRAGRVYRLPTEAEWEYACRAGTQTAFSFGDDRAQLANYAWYVDGLTHPVGTLRANAWGLFDMHGNAWELCSDFYQCDYYRVSLPVDPRGPLVGTTYALRGGARGNAASEARSANRWPDHPGTPHGNVGFRVVCDVPPK